MRKLLLCTMLLPLVLMGCTDPIAAKQDPIQEYPQVHLTSYWLQTHLRVQQPIVSRVGAGQLAVQVSIRNLTDDDLSLDYKYYFMDEKGKQIQESGWTFVKVPRKGINAIDFTSLNFQAADFRVEIRYRE